MAGDIVEPNTWSLTGDGVTVTLRSDAATGEDHLTYQDESRSLSFPGADGNVTKEDTGAGLLLTVVINQTVDAGNTTFSLLLPLVNLAGLKLGGKPPPIVTVGILTERHISFVHTPFTLFQMTSYGTIQLTGTASRVDA
jgi:hypothetical protein